MKRKGKLKGEVASSLYKVKSPDKTYTVDKKQSFKYFIISIKTANKELNAIFRLYWGKTGKENSNSTRKGNRVQAESQYSV